MQTVCIGRSRLKGFWGRFFWIQLGFWIQALSGPAFTAPHRASLRFPRPHEASWWLRRFTAQLSFSYKRDFSYSFSYRFSYKIFSEQLCFPIDLAVSSLLILMLLRNP